MRFVIVTGMSGAGKSTALRTLEDMGYFCVDNLPVILIQKFADFVYDENENIKNVAIGVDIRSGDSLNKLNEILDKMKKNEYKYEILFLDASEQSLVKRYKETRRKHPLSNGGRINDGIKNERSKIEFLKQKADYIIETSGLLVKELNQELQKIFIDNLLYNNIIITFMSFGFKYGIPRDSDLVYDVRFLKNPYYEAELRALTGNDEMVQKYVKESEEYFDFRDKLVDMLKFLVPLYKREGKTQLVVSIGCTGGKHRSITLVNDLVEILKEYPYTIRGFHRDIIKDRIVKGE